MNNLTFNSYHLILEMLSKQFFWRINLESFSFGTYSISIESLKVKLINKR